MNILDKTLGQFLLEKFMGALLDTPEYTSNIPDTIGDMTHEFNDLLCDFTRFRLKEKVDIEDIIAALNEYYTGIGWRCEIDKTPTGEILGSVWPENTCLSLYAQYEDKTEEIFFVSLNSIIG